MVRTWCFHLSDPGSIPGQGTKIMQSHAVWAKKKKKYQINKQKFITTNNKTKQFFL